jgi:hypothetical protein
MRDIAVPLGVLIGSDFNRKEGPMRRIELAKPILTSKITKMIDRILKCWCDENGYRRGSAEASRKAKSLVQWLELGVTDEVELSNLIRDDIVITTRQVRDTNG